MKYVWILLGLVIVLGAIIFWPLKAAQQKIPPAQYKTTTLVMGEGSNAETFTAEIASTPALQELGLSNRDGIAQNAAMIFVFSTPDKYSFWMKDMNFPIDIIWLIDDPDAPTPTVGGRGADSNRRLKIIYIEKNVSPDTYPNAFGPDGNSQYVIEVKAGTAERLKLSLGDQISFSCDGDVCGI